MTKNQIIIAAAAVTTAAVAAYGISILGSETAIFERFPDLDHKLVAKAHRKMVRRAMTGAYNDVDLNDDAVCDRIFLKIYATL